MSDLGVPNVLSTHLGTPEDFPALAGAGDRGSRISWSKNGFIAYACDGPGFNLGLTYMERVDDRSWQLAPSQVLSVKPNPELMSAKCPPLQWVVWSNLSTDLAVADEKGNFHIYLAGVGIINGAKGSVNGNGAPAGDHKLVASPASGGAAALSYELTSYNHLEMIYRAIEPDTLAPSGVVDLKWLQTDKPQIINKPATLAPPTDAEHHAVSYKYGVSQYLPLGLTHPISTKQACVVVRQNGSLQLYYQGEHKVEYHRVSTVLMEEVNFKHASVGFTRDRAVLVVAYDTFSDTIKTFSVKVDWGHLVQAAQRQKTDPHSQTPKEQQSPPKLSVSLLHEMRSVPTELDDDRLDSSKVQLGVLSTVKVVLPYFRPDSDTEVLIGYHTYTALTEEEPRATTLFRYRLVNEADRVSDVFAELGGEQAVRRLERLEFLDKMVRAGSIDSISTAVTDSIIVITFTSGHIDVIDRDRQNSVVNRKDHKSDPDAVPQTINTLFDVGFNIPLLKDAHPGLIALSPNLTSLVYLAHNMPVEQLQFKALEGPQVAVTATSLAVATAGFAYRHSYSCYTNICSDDLLALFQIEVDRIKQALRLQGKEESEINTTVSRFIEQVMIELHRAISFQLDVFGKESVDKLLSNPPLQKLLSMQLILGEIQSHHTNLPARLKVVSDIAWIVLNLRGTSFGIMLLLSSIYRQILKKKPAEDTLQDSITRAECIMSLIGSVKWLIDLMIYINQELLQLTITMQSPDRLTRPSLDNSVALPIILSKIPRLFLMYALSSIGKTNEILKKLHRDLSECKKLFAPMRDAFNRYFTLYSDSPLNISQFEAFLRECDGFIAAEIERESLVHQKGFALELEQKLVCQGVIAKELHPTAISIIKKYASIVRRDQRISELFFYNVDWLSIGVTKQPGDSRDLPSAPATMAVLTYPRLSPRIKPRLRYHNSEYIDGLRKVVLDTGGLFSKRIGPYNPKKQKKNPTENLASLRRCSRCRAVSSINDPLVFASPTTVGLWTMVFQRTCLCGNAWINCIEN